MLPSYNDTKYILPFKRVRFVIQRGNFEQKQGQNPEGKIQDIQMFEIVGVSHSNYDIMKRQKSLNYRHR